MGSGFVDKVPGVLLWFWCLVAAFGRIKVPSERSSQLRLSTEGFFFFTVRDILADVEGDVTGENSG